MQNAGGNRYRSIKLVGLNAKTKLCSTILKGGNTIKCR